MAIDNISIANTIGVLKELRGGALLAQKKAQNSGEKKPLNFFSALGGEFFRQRFNRNLAKEIVFKTLDKKQKESEILKKIRVKDQARSISSKECFSEEFKADRRKKKWELFFNTLLSAVIRLSSSVIKLCRAIAETISYIGRKIGDFFSAGFIETRAATTSAYRSTSERASVAYKAIAEIVSAAYKATVEIVSAAYRAISKRASLASTAISNVVSSACQSIFNAVFAIFKKKNSSNPKDDSAARSESSASAGGAATGVSVGSSAFASTTDTSDTSGVPSESSTSADGVVTDVSTGSGVFVSTTDTSESSKVPSESSVSAGGVAAEVSSSSSAFASTTGVTETSASEARDATDSASKKERSVFQPAADFASSIAQSIANGSSAARRGMVDFASTGVGKVRSGYQQSANFVSGVPSAAKSVIVNSLSASSEKMKNAAAAVVLWARRLLPLKSKSPTETVDVTSLCRIDPLDITSLDGIYTRSFSLYLEQSALQHRDVLRNSVSRYFYQSLMQNQDVQWNPIPQVIRDSVLGFRSDSNLVLMNPSLTQLEMVGPAFANDRTPRVYDLDEDAITTAQPKAECMTSASGLEAAGVSEYSKKKARIASKMLTVFSSTIGGIKERATGIYDGAKSLVSQTLTSTFLRAAFWWNSRGHSFNIDSLLSSQPSVSSTRFTASASAVAEPETVYIAREDGHTVRQANHIA